MVGLAPNFYLNGRCREAVELYREAFGAEVGCLLRYADAAPEDLPKPLREGEDAYVYHCELRRGAQRMMLADQLDMKVMPGLALSLTVTMDRPEDVDRAFGILAREGIILLPLHSTAYSARTGNGIDKFGFRWVIMTEAPGK